MPRLKAVKAEIGTSGDVQTFPLSYAIRGSVFRTAHRHALPKAEAHKLAMRVDIAEAVDREHHCTDNPSCDICEANENGFAFSAAYLLSGATETPLLDAVCAAYGFDPSATSDAVPDWQEWYAHFKANAIKCDSCGAFNFDSDYCGNCLAELNTSERGTL